MMAPKFFIKDANRNADCSTEWLILGLALVL